MRLLRQITDRLAWGLRHAARLLDGVVISLNALGTVLIIIMMGLICADVVGRNLLNSSLPGVVELTELGIVSIVFLQISDALRNGRLMRSDGLLKKVEKRLPRMGHLVNAVFDGTGAVLFYFIADRGFARFFEAWKGNYYIGNQGAFTAPTWPMELAVALGAVVIGVLFCTRMLSQLGGLLGRAAHDPDADLPLNTVGKN